MTFLRRAGTLGLIAAIWLVVAGQSEATFPGLDGPIAFVRDATIFTMDPDGGNPLALTSGKHATDPSVSPDGQQIVYVRTSGHKPYEIIVMNSNGSNPQTIESAYFLNDPAFNPAASRIVFEKNLKLQLAHADGSKVRTLPDGRCNGVLHPSFSPNGKVIAFDCISTKGGVKIKSIHPDGSHLRTLARGHLDGCPSFAPNGKRILYVRFAKSNSDRTKIVSQRLADGSTNTIRTGPGSHLEFSCPEYSPAGDQIVVEGGDFSSPEGGYKYNVFTMQANGSGLVPITGDDDSRDPDWGPALDK
jgi:Tol biopolymer transport system component